MSIEERAKWPVDLNNPIFASPFSPQSQWKRELIIYLGEHFGLQTFVETGTCYGDTIGHVKDNFAEVWSVELSPTFYNKVRRRFANDPHVHLVFGSSGEELPGIISQTTGPLLFWLDAHVTGGPSAYNGSQLTAELEVIQRMRSDSLVLIDDVKPGANGAYSGPDELIVIPKGWQTKFFSGVLALHAGGYSFPEKF